MSENEKKPALIIGTFRNEKIVNEIHLSGREVITKNLTSSPQNWDSIISLLKKKNRFSCVFLSLSESVLLISQCKAYTEKFYEIIKLLENFPHLVLIYKDNLFGKYNIFNTSYYSKYLFYDDFFANRETFNELEARYTQYSNIVRESIIEHYFFGTIIPASFFAEEDEWEKIKSQHGIWFACDHVVQGLYKQLSFYDNKKYAEIADTLEYLYKSNNLERFVDKFRSEMLLTAEERSCFLSLPIEKKYEFIESRFSQKKAQYEEKGYRERDSIGEEEVEAIYMLITSESFNKSVCNVGNWEEREWELFKKYLSQKRYCEDQKIAEACAAMNEIVSNINSGKINLWSYKYSNEIVVKIREFFENENSNVVFRSYILKDRIWANELDSFLNLFQEYITRIRGVNISFEQRRTDIGTIYVIQSTDKSVVKSEFPQYVAEFDMFLTDCDQDIEKARETLRNYCKSPIEVEQYIAKFQIRARRLKTDIRQEYERKMLLLRHELENAALEAQGTENIIPTFTVPALPENTSVVINAREVKMITVPGKLDKLILGDYTYNETDKQLLTYIENLSKENQDLITELRILKDEKASGDQKRSAWGKLKGFLSEHALDIGKLAFDLLSKYLETLL